MAKRIVNPKEYLGFYWFWLWQYYKRNYAYSNLKSDYEQNYKELYEKDHDEELRVITASYEFFPAPSNFGDYSASEILKIIIAEKELQRPKGHEKRRAAKLLSGYSGGTYEGVRIGGADYFGYHAVVALDFRKPLDLLFEEIRFLKELTQPKDMREEELPDYETIQAELDLVRIKKRPGVSFDHTTDTPRAVGLWLWDRVYGFDGATAKRGAIKAAVDALKAEYDVARLGYAASEMGVFRKLLSRTKLCIQKGEVLGLG